MKHKKDLLEELNKILKDLDKKDELLKNLNKNEAVFEAMFNDDAANVPEQYRETARCTAEFMNKINDPLVIIIPDSKESLIFAHGNDDETSEAYHPRIRAQAIVDLIKSLGYSEFSEDIKKFKQIARETNFLDEKHLLAYLLMQICDRFNLGADEI